MNVRRARSTPLIVAVVVVAVVGALAPRFWPGTDRRTSPPSFPRTVSLYEGSDVKILGVAVGKVDTVKPSGTKVMVKFTTTRSTRCPRTPRPR